MNPTVTFLFDNIIISYARRTQKPINTLEHIRH